MKKLLLKAFLLLVVIFIGNEGIRIQAQEDSSFGVFPILLRTAGIGIFYGGGVIAENIGGTSIDVVGAKLLGRLDVEAALIKDIPLIPEVLTLGAGTATLNEIFFDISYTRGAEEDAPVTMQGAGSGAGAFINLTLFEKLLNFSVAYASNTFKFNQYLDEEENEIPLPQLHLTDLESVFLIYGGTLDLTDDPSMPRSGGKVGFSQIGFTNTTELSGTDTFEAFVNVYIPLGDKSTWVFHGFSSDATVSGQAITDIETIRNILNVDCEQVTGSPDSKDKCEQLSENLAKYISAHNQYGTARPLGGNKRLRAYRESRFRSAHSRFVGTEFRFNFPNFVGEALLQLAFFAETGSMADDPETLFEIQRSSYGTGIRGGVGNLLVRLDYATGEEGQEWHLIVGQPW